MLVAWIHIFNTTAGDSSGMVQFIHSKPSLVGSGLVAAFHWSAVSDNCRPVSTVTTPVLLCPRLPQVAVLERTPVTAASWSELQLEAALELQLAVLPVSALSELPQLLAEIAAAAERGAPQPLAGRPPDEPPVPHQVTAALTAVPGLGAKKVDALLAKFGSLAALSGASVPQLTPLLGSALAQSVHQFFNS